MIEKRTITFYTAICVRCEKELPPYTSLKELKRDLDELGWQYENPESENLICGSCSKKASVLKEERREENGGKISQRRT